MEVTNNYNKQEIFSKKLSEINRLFLGEIFKKKVYWDFDDNIISDGEISIREAGILEKYAKSIIVTNEHLAKTISSQYRHKVRFLPTTDCEFETCNIDEIINEKKAEIAKELRLCWVGTRDNLKYLYEIIPVLDETAKYCNENFKKKVLLKVVANKDLEAEYKNLIIENIPWSRKRAARIIKESHIGLMPLKDSDYNRGKGGFKAIQYMSAATLPLVSKVGYNVNVLSDGESGFFCNKSSDWKEKIIFISENTDIWERISREARKSWENKFSPKKVREYWNKVMEGNI